MSEKISAGRRITKGDKRYLAVYGSLRANEYNSRRLLNSGEMSHIGTVVIDGWRLYSFGPYPGIKPGYRGETIVVDIMECSLSAASDIDGMERGAGYGEVELYIPYGGEFYKCTIYPYLHDVSESDRVKSGDWSAYRRGIEEETKVKLIEESKSEA